MASSEKTGEQLDGECLVFCRYLIRQTPTPYICQKYRAGNRSSNLDVGSERSRFELLLVRLASVHPLLTKLVDTYARIFAPQSALRKKLVLLFAILECTAPVHHYLDSADAYSRPGFFARLIVRAPLFLLTLACSAIVLLPLQLLLGGVHQPHSE